MLKIKINTDAPVRLDRYLRRIYPRLTQGVLEKALRVKHITLHNARTTSNKHVSQGDIIFVEQNKFNIDLYLDKHADQIIDTKEVKLLAKKLLSEYLLYECDEFIAINKPYGLATQGGSKISLSIDDAIKYINNISNKLLKLVHRLDKDTSGVLLIAKGYDSSTKLMHAFKERKIEKKYLAIVENTPKSQEGIIQNYIAKDISRDYEIVKEVHAENNSNAKFAETQYKVLSSNGRYSYIEFIPKTGRTHQIRVHSQSLKCPIVGDKKYGNHKYQRMMLHAFEVNIPRDIFGKSHTIQVKCDEFTKWVDVASNKMQH